jgi:hypothetical protein
LNNVADLTELFSLAGETAIILALVAANDSGARR